MHPKQEQQEQKTKNYSNIDSVLAFLTGPAARHGGQSRGSDDITQQRILRAQEILKYGREELKQDLEKLGNMMDQQIVCNRIETMISSDTEQQTRMSSDTEQQTMMSSDTNHGEENSFIHAAILCAAEYDVLQENYDILVCHCNECVCVYIVMNIITYIAFVGIHCHIHIRHSINNNKHTSCRKLCVGQ